MTLDVMYIGCHTVIAHTFFLLFSVFFFYLFSRRQVPS
jgi:hypothetical protein